MLSHTQGASFMTLGTMNQARNGSREQEQGPRGEPSGPGGQKAAIAASGMNSPVLMNQNQAMVSSPWSQPNSKPKNVPALAMLSCVDHQTCGRASASAAIT